MRGIGVVLMVLLGGLISGCGEASTGCQGTCGEPSADAGADAVSRLCVPGVAQTCPCPGGSQGVQTCADDGARFGACMGCPSTDAGPPPDCVPSCSGRECGDDGCGGSCGRCATSGWACNGVGRCVPPDMICRSACSGRECGPDTGMYCDGRNCGTCPSGTACNTSGRCICTPNCAGRECGPDGCGGACGTCAVGRSCNVLGACVAPSGCVSMCAGRMCGADPGCADRVCGTCPSGYACNASGTACVVSGTSNWIITAVRGTVARTTATGSVWDIDGSPPDPYLCLTINGVQRCTEFITDSFAPVWRMNQFPAAPASALLGGIYSVYADDDVGADDLICASGNVAFTAAQLSAGTPVVFSCGSIGSFTLTASPAP